MTKLTKYFLIAFLLLLWAFFAIGAVYVIGYEQGRNNVHGPGRTIIQFEPGECTFFEDGSYRCMNDNNQLSGCMSNWLCTQE